MCAITEPHEPAQPHTKLREVCSVPDYGGGNIQYLQYAVFKWGGLIEQKKKKNNPTTNGWEAVEK